MQCGPTATPAGLIVSEIFTLADDNAVYQAMARAHIPFGDGHASARIAGIVAHGFGL